MKKFICLFAFVVIFASSLFARGGGGHRSGSPPYPQGSGADFVERERSLESLTENKYGLLLIIPAIVCTLIAISPFFSFHKSIKDELQWTRFGIHSGIWLFVASTFYFVWDMFLTPPFERDGGIVQIPELEGGIILPLSAIYMISGLILGTAIGLAVPEILKEVWTSFKTRWVRK
jgi:hypothetical protein